VDLSQKMLRRLQTRSSQKRTRTWLSPLQGLKVLLSNVQLRDASPPHRGTGSRLQVGSGNRSGQADINYLNMCRLDFNFLIYKAKSQSQINLREFLPLQTSKTCLGFTKFKI
jgi:hypothetical protein